MAGSHGLLGQYIFPFKPTQLLVAAYIPDCTKEICVKSTHIEVHEVAMTPTDVVVHLGPV